MKYKLILTLIIILIYSTMALAEPTEIFSSSLSDNEEKTVSGKTISTKYYAKAGKASIKIDDNRFLIPTGSCIQNTELSWKICVDSATNFTDETVGSTGTKYYTAIKIYELGPSLSISRTISESEPTLNSEVTVTTTLTNDGSDRASNVIFYDEYPHSVKISGAYVDMIQNRVYWSGSLMAGKSQTFTYILKFSEFLNYNSTAKASFINNLQTKDYKSSTVEFEVEKPYSLKDSISSTAPALGELTAYRLNISSKTTDVNIKKLTITIPQNVIIINRPLNLELSDNKLTYSSTLDKDSNKEFKIDLQSSTKGEYEIKTTAELSTSGSDFKETLSQKFGIGVSHIIPKIILPDIVEGGTDLSIDASLYNRGKENIKLELVNFDSNIFGIRAWREKYLAPSTSFEILKSTIRAPYVDSATTYYAEITGYYLNNKGNKLEFNEKKTVLVKPPEKFMEFKPIINIKNGIINITLKIKNTKSFELTSLDIIDVLPKGFDYKGKRNREIKSIGPMQEVEAYSYIILLPSSFKENKFTIDHIFNAIDNNNKKILREKKTTINIENTTIKTSDKTIKKDTTKQNNKTQETTKKTSKTNETKKEDKNKENDKGIFKKTWKTLTSVFKWIFGKD